MKIVQILPALEQGGVESVVCDLNRAMTGAGHESLVISRGGKLVERIEGDGGRHFVLDVRSKNPLTCLWRAWRLRKLLQRLQPDLVCVHSRVPAWLFWWANRRLHLRWISYAHGANSVSKYSEVMTRGDLVVTPSRFLADYLQQNYPRLKADRIRIVHPAVDAQRFDPQRLDAEFMAAKRREWGIGDGDRVIMAIGRITKVKGLDSLIRDFAAEHAENPRQKLVIVGGADQHHQQYLESLKSLADSLSLNLPSQSPSVVFAGPQTRVPECLALADVVVSANTVKPESFGLSVVEAYAMNKPVEAKRFGGVGEIMAEVDGYRANHPDAGLRESALALYGMEVMAERTLAVYSEVVNMI